MRKIRRFLNNTIAGKILKFIWKAIKLIFELLILALAITIIVQKITNNKYGLFGYRIFNVASGSMEPQYNIGDILISKEVPPSKIKVGDSIVYQGKVGDYKNKIITHSVIGIEQNEEGQYIFHTKGIANEVEDPSVNETQVYGIVAESNKVLTFICTVISSPLGLYFIIIVPILIYAFSQFFKLQERSVQYESENKSKVNKQEGENDKQQQESMQEVVNKEKHQENKHENEKEENNKENKADVENNNT